MKVAATIRDDVVLSAWYVCQARGREVDAFEGESVLDRMVERVAGCRRREREGWEEQRRKRQWRLSDTSLDLERQNAGHAAEKETKAQRLAFSKK